MSTTKHAYKIMMSVRNFWPNFNYDLGKIQQNDQCNLFKSLSVSLLTC